jgi:hypothetical protein
VRAATRAGFVYFAAVFAAGFVLGTIRVLVLVPRLGEVVPVLLETPIILALSWLAARRTTRRFRVPDDASQRILMGLVAFSMLQLAETGVSIFAFGRSIEDHLAAYGTAHGLIGLLAQIAFAVFPLMQRQRR